MITSEEIQNCFFKSLREAARLTLCDRCLSDGLHTLDQWYSRAGDSSCVSEVGRRDADYIHSLQCDLLLTSQGAAMVFGRDASLSVRGTFFDFMFHTSEVRLQ